MDETLQGIQIKLWIFFYVKMALLLFTHLDRELYMQISFSFRGNDQKIILRCTGSGIRSYRSSIFWKGSFCATSLAVVSSKLSGCRNDPLGHLKDDPFEFLLQLTPPVDVLSQQSIFRQLTIYFDSWLYCVNSLRWVRGPRWLFIYCTLTESDYLYWNEPFLWFRLQVCQWSLLLDWINALNFVEATSIYILWLLLLYCIFEWFVWCSVLNIVTPREKARFHLSVNTPRVNWDDFNFLFTGDSVQLLCCLVRYDLRGRCHPMVGQMTVGTVRRSLSCDHTLSCAPVVFFVIGVTVNLKQRMLLNDDGPPRCGCSWTPQSIRVGLSEYRWFNYNEFVFLV